MMTARSNNSRAKFKSTLKFRVTHVETPGERSAIWADRSDLTRGPSPHPPRKA